MGASRGIPDQRRFWDGAYRRELSEQPRANGPSRFAEEIEPLLVRGARLLELGCGPGRDARFFAQRGHRVVGCDFSSLAVASARAQSRGCANLAFLVADHSHALPFRSGGFDAVYASLTLHYFPDAVTQRIFAEIARVLLPGGLLCFICKSTEDPLYGRGERIEPEMYLRDGHVRHFFSPAYARACLDGRFELLHLWSGRAIVHGEIAAVIKAIAAAGGL